MPVEIPRGRVRDYLLTHSLVAVFVAGERVAARRDLAHVQPPPEAVWWTSPAQACALVRACSNARSTDVEAMAAELHTPLTPHEIVMACARADTARADPGLVEE